MAMSRLKMEITLEKSRRPLTVNVINVLLNVQERTENNDGYYYAILDSFLGKYLRKICLNINSVYNLN